MKDRKKEALIIILGSAFAIAIVTILCFRLFNKTKNNLNGNYENVNLGDVTTCNAWQTSGGVRWSSSSAGCSTANPPENGTSTDYCKIISQYTSMTVCSDLSGGEVDSAPCYQLQNYKRTCSTTLTDAKVGTCNPNLRYKGLSMQIATNGTNTTVDGNYATTVGNHTVTYYAKSGHLFSDGSTSKSISCTISKGLATAGSCTGKLSPVVSEGSNVTYSNNTAEKYGSHTVTVKANNNYAFSDGSTSKTITCNIAEPNPQSLLHCCNGQEYISVKQTNGYPGSCATAGYTTAEQINGNWTCGNGEVQQSANCYVYQPARGRYCSYMAVSGFACNSTSGEYNTYSDCVAQYPKDAKVGTCNSNLVYSGSSMELATDGTNTTIDGNFGTEAKEYTITYTSQPGHLFSDGNTSKSIKCTISKGLATAGSCTGKLSPVVSEGSNVTYSNNTAEKYGSHTVTVNANDNYAFSDGSTSKTLKCNIIMCGDGEYYNNGQCAICGSHGTVNYDHTTCTCDVRYAKDNNGTCNSCSKAYKKDADGACTLCNDGYKLNTTGQCVEDVKCCLKNQTTNKYEWRSKGENESCISNVDNSYECSVYGLTDKEKCLQTSNSYWVNNSCVTCPSGYKAESGKNNGKCYITVPAGSYLEEANSTSITKCAPGSYSTGKDVILGNSYTCTSCGSGKTSSLGATSSSQCYVKEDDSQCTVTATTDTGTMKVSYGSHFNVNVQVSGKGCNGQTITLTTSNATLAGSKTVYDVSDGSGFNFIVNVDEKNTCTSTASLTATLTNKKSATASVTTIVDWHKQTSNKCVLKSSIDGKSLSRAEAERKGEDIYYIVLNNNDCGGTTGTNTETRKVDVWVRGCGSDNSTPPKTPVHNTYCYTNGTDYVWEESAPSGYTKVDGVTQKSRCIPACYSDGTNFEWTNNPKTGYTQVTTITTDTACRAEEPACYLYNGNYIWGKYQSTVGYVLQTSIKDENYCVTPEDNPELACYKNADDDYIWTETAPDGYTKVDDIDNPNACSAPEEPACYLYNNQYVWGAYGRLTGYSLISSILDENHCVKPNSACYISDDGNYVWGDYSLDNYYTLIKDINSKNACLPIEDVPKTDLDVAKVLYIGMSVLLVAGIGFIYYVNYSKKKNNK